MLEVRTIFLCKMFSFYKPLLNELNKKKINIQIVRENVSLIDGFSIINEANNFDLVIIDLDKEYYFRYMQMVLIWRFSEVNPNLKVIVVTKFFDESIINLPNLRRIKGYFYWDTEKLSKIVKCIVKVCRGKSCYNSKNSIKRFFKL